MTPRLCRAVVLALLALPACAPDVPATPTYTKDVQPILAAHCVRCHGANDTLNAMDVYGSHQAPTQCYLHTFNDEGDCSVGDGGVVSNACKHGVKTCSSLIYLYAVKGTAGSKTLMPPPPSDPLNAWEKDVITRWSSVNPPAQ